MSDSKHGVWNILLDEKTRISINIVTLVSLISFVVTMTLLASKWTAKIDDNEAAIQVEREERMASDKDIAEEMSEIKKVQIQSDIEAKANFAEIKTDLKWIRAYMEKGG